MSRAVGPEARVALVTGASAGIGRACADVLASDGWEVVGASRRGTAGKRWKGLVMDVDDDLSVRRAVDEVLDDQGRIDALVAAAGWGLAGPAELTSIEEAKAQLETNFWGVVRTAQRVLPSMRARRRGRIVIVSSIGGLIALPFQAFYSASKFALEGLGEAMAYEVEPFGVQVTLIEPGNIATDFTSNRRTIRQSRSENPYTQATTKAISAMERDELDGAEPLTVASAVAKVLDSRKPPRRLSVGRAGERVGLLAKRALPFRIFEAAARGSLGVD